MIGKSSIFFLGLFFIDWPFGLNKFKGDEHLPTKDEIVKVISGGLHHNTCQTTVMFSLLNIKMAQKSLTNI